MIAFLRRFAPVAGALSMLALTGCSSVMQFPTSNLPQPRPSAENVKAPSMAMQIASEIRTTNACIGCADTLLWDDEAHLAKEAGFDPEETQRQIAAARKERGQDESRDSGDGLFSIGSGYMVADSMDGIWNNSPSIGTGLGVGLGLGLLSRVITAKSDIDVSPATENFKFAYVFPSDRKYRVKGYQPEASRFEEDHARLYAAKTFVDVAAKTAEDFGFKRIGEIRVGFFRQKNGLVGWSYIWQPLENEALGCPKVTEKTERDDMCRVEWAPYWSLTKPVEQFWIFRESLVPKVMGGDGKKTAWMAFFGYDNVHFGPLYVDEASNVPDEGKLLHDFALGMQKHMTKGMYAYVPSYKIDGKNTPQVVMDKDHVYNFAVIVPREGAKVAPPAAK